MWLLAAVLMAAAPAPVPKPVTDFIERRQECDHWAGEEPYDPARRAEIEDALADLRCEAIGKDEAKLRQRYAADAQAIKTLDDSDRDEQP